MDTLSTPLPFRVRQACVGVKFECAAEMLWAIAQSRISRLAEYRELIPQA